MLMEEREEEEGERELARAVGEGERVLFGISASRGLIVLCLLRL